MYGSWIGRYVFSFVYVCKTFRFPFFHFNTTTCAINKHGLSLRHSTTDRFGIQYHQRMCMQYQIWTTFEILPKEFTLYAAIAIALHSTLQRIEHLKTCSYCRVWLVSTESESNLQSYSPTDTLHWPDRRRGSTNSI